MFTGIIEETGTITAVKKENNSAYFKIAAKTVLEGTKAGDSIAVNGTCQTVTKLGDGWFEVFSSYETLRLTTLGSLNAGSVVNLERALRLSDRLGGHIVSGHVDAPAVLKAKNSVGEAVEFVFKAPEAQMRQIAKKGSVTLDGVSLTVAEVFQDSFSVAVIPHTIENTTLKLLKTGDKVNLETDLLSKYVEKYLSPDHNKNTLDIEFLKENGFL